MVNQPNYNGGLLILVIGILFMWFLRKPPGPPTPQFPEAIVRDYRSFGQSLEEGYEADRKAFLAFKALAKDAVEEAHQLELPLGDLAHEAYFELRSAGYDPAADAKAQGVGE